MHCTKLIEKYTYVNDTKEFLATDENEKDMSKDNDTKIFHRTNDKENDMNRFHDTTKLEMLYTNENASKLNDSPPRVPFNNWLLSKIALAVHDNIPSLPHLFPLATVISIDSSCLLLSNTSLDVPSLMEW